MLSVHCSVLFIPLSCQVRVEDHCRDDGSDPSTWFSVSTLNMLKIRTLTEKEELVLSLERQYPEDVGVLAAHLFNYVKLSPGEAIYIGANEPHAYLSGECIECMATSDNVVRAGLTPRYRDVQTLYSMLTYKQIFPEVLRGVPVQPYIRRYTPTTDEFEVDCCLLPPGEVAVMPPVPGPSIFLVMAREGEVQADSMSDGEKAKEGDVFFVPAHTECYGYEEDVLKKHHRRQRHRPWYGEDITPKSSLYRIQVSILFLHFGVVCHPGESRREE